ncbi:transcriptional adapter 3 [Parasteatoda tepidariorum]|uniref:transcriptional adapter 3 n=1 Tax=Parasteatoda tepidariorum TaxID=114398 RepID=UPI001C71BF40|nr:transcriptional adapter 3 [Parasteatoda tepidariorum]
MQVCMLRRQEKLKVEISNLENPAAKRNKRSRSSDSGGKNAKQSKKCKGNGKKASTPCRPKNKFVQPPPRSYECGVTDALVETPKPTKNDGPSRFWSFIEPYCADITEDDIKSIETWINSHEEDAEYQKIPELGNHFAEQWPKDEMSEELKEGSKSVENQKGSLDTDLASMTKEKVLKLGEKECKQMERKNNSHQNNSLIKRLVSTLVQENVMTPLDVCLAESSKDEAPQVSKPKTPSKQNSPSKESLHKKLCRGLNEIGAMEFSESNLDEPEDEILAELKRLQKELIPVCNRNLRQKKHLLAMAKAEIKKQDVKKKLKEIDAKLMEIYREIYAARCENKAPPKKYAAQIRKTISERQLILKQLEDMT